MASRCLVGLAAVLILLLLAAVAYERGGSRRKFAGIARTTPPALAATVEVRDPDVARRLIIGHADIFSDHPASPFPVDLDGGHPKTTSINSAPYGPLWRALRSNLTAGALHPSRLARCLPLQRRAAEALVADLAAAVGDSNGAVVVTVRDALYEAVFGVVVRMCFGDGVGERDVGTMRRTLREFFDSGVDAGLLARSRIARLLRWRQWRRLVGTRGRLAQVFVPVIEARRQTRRPSRSDDGVAIPRYVDSLIDLRVPDGDGEPAGCNGNNNRRRGLRDDEIAKLVWEFLGAGTETVVACVERTLARLVAHPEVQSKLHQELTSGDRRNEERLHDWPFLRAVILESLRLHPPVPFILRDAGHEGAAFGGAAPPPDGAPVRFVFMAEDIGRDPNSWTDPDEFRPERFLDGGEGEDVSAVPGPKEIKMMPLGAGRRHCPGAGIAMAHAACFVAALVRKFEWAPPDDGGGVDFTAIGRCS